MHRPRGRNTAGQAPLTEEEAQRDHDCIVEVVRYDHLPRAIIDGRTEGLCKLIVDRGTRTLLGAHVLGSYSAEIIQVAATCMAAALDIRKIAELELAFPTFTEAIGTAARRCVQTLGLEPPEWAGTFEELPASVKNEVAHDNDQAKENTGKAEDGRLARRRTRR